MLELQNISKRFGSVIALDQVSATFHPGEVHAVLGENGAGKSTLASIVSGFVVPSGGTVRLEGREVPAGKPFECKRLGIEMIHQHFTLVPEFTVAENLALSSLKRLNRTLDVAKVAEPALQAAARLGWRFDPQARIRELPVGVQQRLEIVKALAVGARVIVFDEPTAVLSAEEVGELMRVLHKVRDEGRIVLLIAHKLAEVMEIADRVTVLRRGRKIAEAAKGDFDKERLAEWMVGEMPALAVKSEAGHLGAGLDVRELVVKGDRGERAVDGISLSVQKGEVLGVGGVDGNGQLELAEAVAGVRNVEGGSISWVPGGKALAGYIPQDRQKDGLALSLSVVDNMLVTGHRRPNLTWHGFLKKRQILEWAKSLIEQFAIRVSGPFATASSLSGGNQQKLIVSRTLDHSPGLLVVAGPTRGLDIRATAFVREQVRRARDEGSAVLLFSADLDELSELSDRTIFISGGRLVEGADAAALLGGGR